VGGIEPRPANLEAVVASMAPEHRAMIARFHEKVRETPSWPRSRANFSLL
jgi:hypothetical protein